MSTPTTDTGLWEYVHRLFGIGDWDELTSDEPFWKYQRREVVKVKAKRTKMKTDIETLVLAADYCKAHGIDIRNVAWLYRYIPPARSWLQERQRALAAADLDDLISEAVDFERECMDTAEYAGRYGADYWIDRLLRARGEHRQEVYEEWKATRNASLSSASPR